MSSPYRRPKGTPTVSLNLFVAPDVKEKIDAYASIANAPLWAIVEAAIRAGVPDESGIPADWTILGPDNEPWLLPEEQLPGFEGGKTPKSA